MKVNKIAIIGVGLIGGSLALSCKKNKFANIISGCAKSKETIKDAIDLGIIDEGSTYIENVVCDADIVVLCTPLGTYEKLAEEISKHIKNDAILTDAGSVKNEPSNNVLSKLLDTQKKMFVPAHPIAGTEKSGPSAAFSTLYNNKKIILTPLSFTDVSAINKVRYMWESVGGIVEVMEADKHDFIYAIVSHNIQLISYAFGAMIYNLSTDIKNSITSSSDTNFNKFIRLTGSDVVMWKDIFLENKKYLIKAVNKFEDIFNDIATLIRQNDTEALRDKLKVAAEKRINFQNRLLNKNIEIPDKSNYDADKASFVWLDILPRLISAAIIETIPDKEYEHASGAGLYGMTLNLTAEGATNADNILKYRQEVLHEMKRLLSLITDIKSLISADNTDLVCRIISSARGIYSQ